MKQVKQHILKDATHYHCGLKKTESTKTAFYYESDLYDADCNVINHVDYKKKICLNCLNRENPELIARFERERKLRFYKHSLPTNPIQRKRYHAIKRIERNRLPKKHYNVIELPWVPVIAGLIEYKPVIIHKSKSKGKKLIKHKLKAKQQPIIERKPSKKNNKALNAPPVNPAYTDIVINPMDQKIYEVVELTNDKEFIAVVSVGNQAMIVLKIADKNGKITNESLTGWIDKDTAIKQAEELLAA